MRRTKQLLWAVTLATAGLISACGSGATDTDCDDINRNGICDDQEQGHGHCDALDRDAQGQCTDGVPHCNGIQILNGDVCEDCPAGDISQNNVCVTPSVLCATNEIVVNEACVDCGPEATATANECVPHCEDHQILVKNECTDCAEGHVNDGNNLCVSGTSPTCVDGEVLVDGVCVPDTPLECGDGEVLVDGVCVPDTPLECDEGEVLIDGVCVFDNSNPCEGGMIRVDGVCCEDYDGDGLCDDDPADDCVGLENGSDADGDGFCADVDCNDNDARVYPGADEICGWPVVNDCNNPCYEEGCREADLFAAKDGKVGQMTHGFIGVWSDVTDEIVGPNNAYQVSNERTLYFCGEGPFQVYPLATGSGTLHLRSGLEGVTPTLSAFDEDRPVVSVSYQAALTLQGLTLEHQAGFEGIHGHGLRCEQATVTISDVTFRNNAASEGGGVHANLCLFHMDETVVFDENRADRGAGMFITGRTNNSARRASLHFEGNITADSDSAALHVEKGASVLWNQSADMPQASFRGNVDQSGQPRDIRVTAGGGSTATVLEIREALFFSSGAGHVRTDSTTHLYSTGVDLACTTAICLP